MTKFPFLAAAALMLPGAAAGSATAGETPHFVPMSEIRVPIVERDRADGVLRLKLVFQATSAATAERTTADLPVLRAAAVGAAVEFARLYASPMTPVDAARLAAQMTATIRAADAGVTRVLLVEVAAVPV